MPHLSKQAKDRARHYALMDLVERYRSHYDLLKQGWAAEFRKQGLDATKVSDRAKHAAMRDLRVDHEWEFVRFHRSWIEHFQKQHLLPEFTTPQTQRRARNGRFLPLVG